MPTTTDKPERRKNTRAAEQPTLIELRAVFHRIWTTQVGKPDYSKRDWRELQRLLYRMFKVEV